MRPQETYDPPRYVSEITVLNMKDNEENTGSNSLKTSNESERKDESRNYPGIGRMQMCLLLADWISLCLLQDYHHCCWTLITQ